MSAFFFKLSVAMLDLALFGLIAVICLCAYTVFKVKTDIMRNAKRFYERPTRGGKNLVVAGRGIALQETVRAKRIAGMAKATATAVTETAQELTAALRTLNNGDVRMLLERAQTTAKWAGIAANFARTVTRQGAAPAD